MSSETGMQIHCVGIAGKYGLACLVQSRCEQTRQMLMSAAGLYLALLKAGRQPLEAQPGLGY